MSDTLKSLITDLIKKWQTFASETQRSSLPEYEQGVAVGFEAAAEELRTLLHQLDREVPDITIQVIPPEAPLEPRWEYFYLTFDQSPDGVWRVKHLNGVWQPNWQQGTTFDEAVRQLTEQGWRLARFANGIHVFKRGL